MLASLSDLFIFGQFYHSSLISFFLFLGFLVHFFFSFPVSHSPPLTLITTLMLFVLSYLRCFIFPSSPPVWATFTNFHCIFINGMEMFTLSKAARCAHSKSKGF